GQDPAPIHVRPPALRHGRHPDASVLGNPFPMPIWHEALVEDAVVVDVGTGGWNALVVGDRPGRFVIRGRRRRLRRRVTLLRRRRALRDGRRRIAPDLALIEAAAARSRDRESGKGDELSWHR